MSRRPLMAVLGLLIGAGAAAPSLAAEPAEVRQRIEQRFGVRVLQISRIERRGQQLFAVRIMTPGGPHNDAWQVNELLVSPRTGRLLSAFRHRASGYGLDGPILPETAPGEPEELIRVSLPPDGRTVPVRAAPPPAPDADNRREGNEVGGDR